MALVASRFRRKDPSIEASLRRIAGEEIDTAIAALDDPALDPARKIHLVRQQCKALRALIRLVRPGFAGFDDMDRTFRDLARALGGPRDAAVLAATIDALAAPHAEALAAADLRAICAHLAGTTTDEDLAASLTLARQRLVEAGAHVRRWTLDGGGEGSDADDGWRTVLGPGAARTFRHARRQMRVAFSTGAAAEHHRWRKFAKYHWHHVRLLRAMAPHHFRGRARRARALADSLGERHDLDMLIAAFMRLPAELHAGETAERLCAFARTRIARIDRRTRRLGAALFAEKPRPFTAHWGRLWQAWRNERRARPDA